MQEPRAQHAEIHALLRRTTDDEAAANPAPQEWSIKQVVQHVTDAERLFAFRAVWFARGETAALPGMEPNPWVANTNANARSLADLLAEFDHVRAALIVQLINRTVSNVVAKEDIAYNALPGIRDRWVATPVD